MVEVVMIRFHPHCEYIVYQCDNQECVTTGTWIHSGIVYRGITIRTMYHG